MVLRRFFSAFMGCIVKIQLDIRKEKRVLLCSRPNLTKILGSKAISEGNLG